MILDDDAFDARLRDELGIESGADDAWATYASAEREWSATGPLGDETHRARVWAASERRRRARDDAGRREATSRRDARDDDSRKSETTRACGTTRRTRGDADATTGATTIDAYRRAWRRLERARARKSPARAMRAKDFPFVDDALTSRAATLRDFLTSDAPRGDARARLREELVRWHPDKFSKYLDLAREEDLGEIRDRVNATSRAVRDAFKASAAAAAARPR